MEKTQTPRCIFLPKFHTLSVVYGTQIPSKSAAKYLGVVFHPNLRMSKSIKMAVEEKKMGINIGYLMPDVRHLNNSKRKLPSYVVYLTLLCGAPAWRGRHQDGRNTYVNILEHVQRKVIDHLEQP